MDTAVRHQPHEGHTPEHGHAHAHHASHADHADHAGHRHPHTGGAPSARDPVCGMLVALEAGKPSLE